MKRYLFLTIPILLLAAACNKQAAVQPVQNQQAQATPTPTPSQTEQTKPIDETANWKTYTNDKYGFGFSYPSIYTVKASSESRVPGEQFIVNIVGLAKGPNSGPAPFINVVVWDNSNKLSALDWATANVSFSNYSSHEASTSLKNEILSGHKAISYSWQGEGYGKTAVIENNQTLILFNTLVGNNSDQVLQDFDRVLSTFKFTK